MGTGLTLQAATNKNYYLGKRNLGAVILEGAEAPRKLGAGYFISEGFG